MLLRFLRRHKWFTIALVLGGLALWIDVPQHPSIQMGKLSRDLNVHLGLDLQGGSRLTYRANTTGIPENEVTQAIEGARDVIERRVNMFGISEPTIQATRTRNEHRIVVELAGVHDPAAAITLIGQTPQLDFRREVVKEKKDTPVNTDQITGGEFTFERTELSGRHLKRASVEFDQVLGTPHVSLEFDGEGSDLFTKLTRENVGKRIAIYLDGVPISAPVVQQEITNGRAVITGGFNIEEANELARNLRAGALPIPVELIGQQTIGPSLGRISIEQSIAAGIIGLIGVAVWMIVFYRLPGAVAVLALLFYTIYFLALVKLIPITLTLAGVTGFVLSIGMAVDANVLIFERMRENVRSGKNLDYAVSDGFREAWDSIRVSNVSSLISALILYGLGTSIVRGFALTFALGVIISMFTAIVVTRSFLEIALAVPKLRTPFWLGVKTSPST